jgi:hypothetical protein
MELIVKWSSARKGCGSEARGFRKSLFVLWAIIPIIKAFPSARASKSLEDLQILNLLFRFGQLTSNSCHDSVASKIIAISDTNFGPQENAILPGAARQL